MSGILSTIIGRHVQPENPISPRPKGLFEQDHLTSQLMASPFQTVAEQEPSQTETTLSTINNPENALEKVGNPNSNSSFVDGMVSNRPKPENKLLTLDPATGKKTNPIVRKINVLENPDNKPNQEGIPSPNISRLTKERSNENQSPDQKPATRLRDGIHEEPKNPSSSIPEERILVETKPFATSSKVSINHKEPLARSTSFSQNLDTVPESNTDKTAANPGVKRELQNAIYLQQKNVGNREYSSLKNENKQAPPTIKITIGRIEIKAINPQKSTIQKNREPSKARISLNDFLDKKENY